LRLDDYTMNSLPNRTVPAFQVPSAEMAEMLRQHNLRVASQHGEEVYTSRKRNGEGTVQTEPRIVLRLPKGVQEVAQITNTKGSKATAKKKKSSKDMTVAEIDKILQKDSSSDISSGIMDRANELLKTSTSATASSSTTTETDRNSPIPGPSGVIINPTKQQSSSGEQDQIQPTEEIEILSVSGEGQLKIVKVEPQDMFCLDSEYTEEFIDVGGVERNKPEQQVPEQKVSIETRATIWLGGNKPKERERLSKARHLLALPDTAALWIFPEQDNRALGEIGYIVRTLHSKVKSKQHISDIEFWVMAEYTGFQTCWIAESYARREISRATVSTKMAGEVALPTATAIILSPPRSGQRVSNFLDLDRSWRSRAKAIMVGFEDLILQLDEMKHEVINLSEEQIPEYPVRSDYEHMSEHVIRESDLYRCLDKKLELIGKAQTLPIFIEYSPYPANSRWKMEETAGSFLKVIQTLQKEYCGPVVVITTSPHYLDGESINDYVEKKSRCQRVTRILHCLGQALGVGTVHLWIGSFHCQDGFYMSENSRRYPLYTAKGSPTAEYSHRYKIKMTYLVSIFDKYYTSGSERLEMLK